jgi:hypothetical protein
VTGRLLALALLLGSACATVRGPSSELVAARRAFAAALEGPAPLATEDLDIARRSLGRAELAHQEDPGSPAERHLAYLALRNAEIARVNAETAALRDGR